MVRSNAIWGMRVTKSAFSLLASKSLPGTSPIFANLASAGASAAGGGFVFGDHGQDIRPFLQKWLQLIELPSRFEIGRAADDAGQHDDDHLEGDGERLERGKSE